MNRPYQEIVLFWLGVLAILLVTASVIWPHSPHCRSAVDDASAAICVKHCEAGSADACDQLGWWYGAWGPGAEAPTPPRNKAKGRLYWKRACALGRVESCGRGERP